MTPQSEELFDRAKKIIPGGVNSPVRAFMAVGGRPVFIERAQGSKIYDVDGNEYIDYVGSWGPMIAGHAHPEVIDAVNKTAMNGTSFGAPTKLEVDMANMVVEAVPSIDVVRMVNSGTEATMSAVRLARGYTGRDKIIKFDGCYHGHVDSLLVSAGSGVETLGLPDSPGVPSQLAALTISLPFNDVEAVEKTMDKDGGDIACIILEPVVGNMGCIPPRSGYLESLRAICDKHGALLIFDEVMTGFRVAFGGAQALYGVTPDITTLGKVIGGGLPVGAYGGRKDIMEKIAPSGPVYQAGTLSGNPLAMTAGLATMRILQRDGTYEKLERLSAKLCDGLKELAKSKNIPATFNRVGAMFSIFFTDTDSVRDYNSAKTCDTKKFARYFIALLANGVYVAPSQFEAGFMSLAHTDEDIEKTLQAAETAFDSI